MPTDTKTALMDCAERAVRARGFDGFSYADLAEAVGIRKASIHHHFPTKANLSEALMERYFKTFETTCFSIETTSDTGAERLSALIDVYRNALNKGQTLCLCVAFIGSRESLSEALNTKIRTFRKMVVDWLTATFEMGQKDGSIANVSVPHHEARAALALLEGAHLAARADEDLNVFNEAVALLGSRLSDQGANAANTG